MARIKETREIPLAKIEIGRGQVRTSQVEKDLDELAESIRKVGLLEPIVVCETEDGKFEVISGQRRFLAHHRIGADTITAGILDTRVTEIEGKVLSVTENLMRRDVNTKDLRDVCEYLYRHYGSIQNVVEHTGLPRNKVSQYVKYDQLVGALKTLVDGGAVEIETALRAQRAASVTGHVNAEEAVKFATEMSGMSGAQQRKIVTDRARQPDSVADDIIEDAKSGGRITQILVTLTADAHAALGQYARAARTNLDDAAGQLIRDALYREDLLEDPA